MALPGDTFEIRRGINHVRRFEGTLGNIEKQQILPNIFMPTERWREKGIFPQDSLIKWSILEFGPFYVPAKGDEITMTRNHYSLYGNLIKWEQKKNLILKGDSVWMNDSLIQSYRFKENYYFVTGDQVISSHDSRYWGLLPESYIVGVATWIWKSTDRKTNKTRWDRIMKAIE